jgi:hypothetical protein
MHDWLTLHVHVQVSQTKTKLQFKTVDLVIEPSTPSVH